jgi:hypothetical protein
MARKYVCGQTRARGPRFVQVVKMQIIIFVTCNALSHAGNTTAPLVDVLLLLAKSHAPAKKVSEKFFYNIFTFSE